MPAASAAAIASLRATIPTWFPSAPMRRTGSAVIWSLVGARLLATLPLSLLMLILQYNTAATRYIVCEERCERFEIHGSQVLTTTGAHGHSL